MDRSDMDTRDVDWSCVGGSRIERSDIDKCLCLLEEKTYGGAREAFRVPSAAFVLRLLFVYT